MFDKLFEPVKIGTLELKNRIAMAPMATGTSETVDHITHVPGERTVAYYEARAKGGCGLLMTEFVSFQPMGISGPHLGEIFTEEAIEGWKNVTDACHKYGAKLSVEIGHKGRTNKFSQQTVGEERTVSASAQPCHILQGPVREITVEEIHQAQRDFVQCVKNAIRAGFDAVELHFANGYFLSSFISGRTNNRVDEYGGTLENRLRMPVELIKMIRAEIGNDYPLFLRMGTSEPRGGRSLEETKLMARAFEEAGITALDLNVGSYTEWDYEFPSYYLNNGFNMDEVEQVRKVVHIPVIGGGRITEPRMAEALLIDDRVDVVQLGRALLADPEWCNKVQEGRIEEIRRCIACTRCIEQLSIAPYYMKCSVNPFVCNEATMRVVPADTCKKVLVVGGGPAGLQAAITAAKRGHKVTLTEKKRTLGGLVRTAAVPPMKWETASLVTALTAEAKATGVEILLQTEADAAYIKQFAADEVILATGSKTLVPKIPGIEDQRVISAIDLLNGDVWVGEKIAILGGGMIGAETADYIAEYEKEVTIFEMADQIAGDMWRAMKMNVLPRLKRHEVTIHTGSKVVGIEVGKISYEKNGQRYESEAFDTIILALGLKSENHLSEELTQAGIAHQVIGDVVKPGRFYEVLVQGAEAGMRI